MKDIKYNPFLFFFLHKNISHSSFVSHSLLSGNERILQRTMNRDLPASPWDISKETLLR